MSQFLKHLLIRGPPVPPPPKTKWTGERACQPLQDKEGWESPKSLGTPNSSVRLKHARACRKKWNWQLNGKRKLGE